MVLRKATMTCKWQQLFWLALWLTGATTPGGLHAALTPEKLYRKVLPSVMTLEVETQSGEAFFGSAVLALADDVVLTAWHVVADARSVRAVFADGQHVKVIGCIARDDRRDLALLKLERRMPHRQAAVGRELQPVATRVYVIGTPKGYGFSITDGLISQTRLMNGFLQYQLSCPISPGNSGSPIFNQRGEVIGIASWAKTDAQNLSFAIPSPEFLRFKVTGQPETWEQRGTTILSSPPTGLLKSGQVTEPLMVHEMTGAEGYAAYQKWFHDARGKSVSVVVQEADRTNTFRFTVE